MEHIKDYLEEDEKILWIYTRERNFLKGPITYLTFQIIFIIIASILLVPWIVNSQGPMLLIGVMLYLIFVIGIGSLIPISIRGLIMMKKRLNVDYEDLKTYHEVYAMTDRKWIQKNYHWNFARKSGFNAYPEDVLIRDVDCVSVKLAEIEAICTRKNGTIYDAYIYTSFKKDKPFAKSYLAAFLPQKFFDDFVEILVNETEINYSSELNEEKSVFTREKI